MVRVCQSPHGQRLRSTHTLETCLDVLDGRRFQDNDAFMAHPHTDTPH